MAISKLERYGLFDLFSGIVDCDASSSDPQTQEETQTQTSCCTDSGIDTKLLRRTFECIAVSLGQVMLQMSSSELSVVLFALMLADVQATLFVQSRLAALSHLLRAYEPVSIAAMVLHVR